MRSETRVPATERSPGMRNRSRIRSLVLAAAAAAIATASAVASVLAGSGGPPFPK
jgi:hypothetical protein